MESADASKLGDTGAPMWGLPCRADAMERRRMQTSDARKTRGGRHADLDPCGPAKPMQTTDASKTRRDWRADVGNSGAVKLMKIAAAKAAVKSATGKPG